MENVTEADHYAATLSSEPRGVLRISVPLDFGQLLIRHLIKPFMLSQPKLKIDLCIIDREVDLIAERFDLALRIGPGILKDSNLVGKKLFDVEMGLFASTEFLKKHGEPYDVSELRSYPFIFFPRNPDQSSNFLQLLPLNYYKT